MNTTVTTLVTPNVYLFSFRNESTSNVRLPPPYLFILCITQPTTIYDTSFYLFPISHPLIHHSSLRVNDKIYVTNLFRSDSST